MKWMSKPLLGTQLNWAHPLNKGLVGYWLFNEGMGDKVNDLSMNGNIGTLMGMAFPSTVASGWNPSKKGVGLNFDGVNDYVDAGNAASLNITAAITVEAWIKLSTVSANQVVVAKWYSGGWTINSYLLYIGQDLFNNKFGFSIQQTNGIIIIIHSTDTFNINEWTHIVGVADGFNLYVYKNGVSAGIPVSYDGSIAQQPTRDTIIGKLRQEDNVYLFNGSISEVRIYNRALSVKEIMELYIDPYGMFL